MLRFVLSASLTCSIILFTAACGDDDTGSNPAPDPCAGETCSGNGTCDADSGEAVCECDTGYTGAACDSCATGYSDDGTGACTMESGGCVASSCSGNGTCSDASGSPVCSCSVGYAGATCADCATGYSDSGGACVMDTGACTVDSCNSNGTCDDTSGAVVCTCDAGYAGAACESCAAGYSNDGAGNCLMDTTCVADSCNSNGTCDDTGGGVVCTCDAGYAGVACEGCAAGYSDDGAGNCLMDTTCVADSCNSNGTCDDTGGGVVCTCDAGYAGVACEGCAAGYSDDGAGNCVMDSATCVADSCSSHGTCDDTSGSVVCTCDTGYDGATCAACATGYSDDGAGTCVMDSATCVADSCSSHGTCDDTSGSVVCTCDTGYDGATCAACATGYVADGANCIPDTGAYHPSGWTNPVNHGGAFKDGTADCKMCHGADLTGQGDAVSCDSCHANGWRTNCTFCHGGTDNNTGAPPEDLAGVTATSEQTVGAHTTHVTGTNHMTYDCNQCHVKPTTLLSPGHVLDATPGAAELDFSAGLSSGASFNSPGCADLYCHGDGENSNGTVADHTGTIDDCTSCHGAPPDSGQHQRGVHRNRDCSACHSDVAGANNAITGPELHVNGEKDVNIGGGTWNATTGSCNPGCHGSENW